MLEFRCRKCRRLLQVTDDSAGQQARCPACATVNHVPTADEAQRQREQDTPPASSAPLTQHEEHPGEQFDATLPYQQAASANAPRSEAAEYAAARPYAFLGSDPASAAPTGGVGAGQIMPTPILVGDVCARSWGLFLDNLGGVIAASLTVYLLNAVCGALVNSLHHGAVASNDNAVAASLIGLITYVTSTAFSIWLTAGLIMYLLRIARGETAHFGQLFEAGPLLVPAAAVSILYSLIVTVGLIACVVPGVILGLMYWMALPLLIDKRLGVVEAFRVSQQVTMGNKWALAGIWLISVGLAIAGFAACGVGAIFTLPFVALLQVVTYLAMTGQPIALPRTARAAAPAR